MLTEALRPLGDPIEIQDVATRLLGEFLQVSRVAYGEVTSDDVHMDYERNYVAEGVQVIAGRFRMADYGTELLAALRRGEALVEPDIAHSAVLSPAERAAYASLSIAALVGFPLIKDGRFVANLAVHHQQPRAWSADDVAAIAETTERTWEAVSRARAEAALRLSEAKYRVLFDTIEEGVVLHEFVRDASGTVVDARYTDSNRALQLLTGLQPALLIGRLVSEVNPTDFPYWLPLLQRVATGEIIRTEHFNPDFGRWFESTLYPDGSERVIGLFRDIDARKRAEAALQASEEWHRLAMESGRVVTWSWDLRARQVRGEPAFFALWGLPTPTDSLPVEAFTARLSADHAAAIEAVMARSVASGEQFDGELYITTGPTAGHWLRWRGRAHGETPWKLTGVSFDITAERQAEEQLRAAHAQLEQRVRERTQQVRMLFRRLVSVQEEERRKLARDLHDQLGQQMTALRMGLEDIAGRAASATASRIRAWRFSSSGSARMRAILSSMPGIASP